jgi:hypothetical protein
MWQDWNEYLEGTINSNDPDFFDEKLSLSSIINRVKKAS